MITSSLAAILIALCLMVFGAALSSSVGMMVLAQSYAQVAKWLDQEWLVSFPTRILVCVLTIGVGFLAVRTLLQASRVHQSSASRMWVWWAFVAGVLAAPLAIYLATVFFGVPLPQHIQLPTINPVTTN